MNANKAFSTIGTVCIVAMMLHTAATMIASVSGLPYTIVLGGVLLATIAVLVFGAAK